MKNTLLNDNQALRLTVRKPLLLCFSLFTVWQMGIVFFTGTSLSLDGKTPLPIVVDNTTTAIIIAYIFSIIYLVFLSKYSVVTARIGISISLICAICLFLPLPDSLFVALVIIQTFCCVFLIGISISIVIGLFTEKTEIYDILITAVFAYTLIAILQNDIIKVSFLIFNAFTIIALAALLVFFFNLPVKIWPKTIKKRNELKCPTRFTIGIYFLIGFSCILTLFGNTVAESINGGISILNVSTAICGVVIFLLWKFFNISPIKCATTLIGLAAVGFVLALANSVTPVFTYIACFLLGCGCLACTLASFYGIVLFKRYPSRFVAPFIVALAVLTVLLHSLLLNAFRNNINNLYILYAISAVIAAVLFLVAEPSLIWSIKRGELTKLPDTVPVTSDSLVKAGSSNLVTSKSSILELDEKLSAFTIEPLSGQELRVTELILSGYTNAEMVDILGITINTIKSYRKNLYEKLHVHSRRELFALVNYEDKK